MARVFQNPNNNLALSMTVEQHLSMAKTGWQAYSLRRGITNSGRTGFLESLAELDMGLEKKLKDPVGSLSGGQKQALVLLMATLRNPDLLLLDECTAGLDAQASDHILHLIEKLILEKKITTLMVIHNLEHALRYGNRLLMIHQGSIILDLNQEEKKTKTPKELVAKYKQQTGRHYAVDSDMVWEE